MRALDDDMVDVKSASAGNEDMITGRNEEERDAGLEAERVLQHRGP